MALAVQDDAGSVDGATSYVDLAYFKAYALARGRAEADADDEAIEVALVEALDYMDARWTFAGDRSRPEQRTQWPRVGAEDLDGLTRPGIPPEVREAQCEYAFVALAGALEPTPTRDASGRVVQSLSRAMGPVSKSVTYSGGAAYERPRYPRADQKLRPVLVASGTASRG